MTIGLSLFRDHGRGDLEVRRHGPAGRHQPLDVGVILMVVGAVGLLVSLWLIFAGRAPQF
jgi:hypothetical protein